MINFLKKNLPIILSYLVLVFVLLVTLVEYGKEFSTFKDPFLIYYNFISGTFFYTLVLLMPLFVIVPTTFFISKEFHSGIYKYYLQRMSYRKLIKSKLCNVGKVLFILPLFAVLLFIVSCFVAKSFSVGVNRALYDRYLAPDVIYLDCFKSFVIIYLVDLFLHSILYMNIAFIYIKKYSNIAVSIIFSYLTFIVLDIIFEVFIGGLLFGKLLNIGNVGLTLNLFNIWTYDSVISMYIVLGYSFLLAFLSSIIVFIKYRNKEEVIMSIEKN